LLGTLLSGWLGYAAMFAVVFSALNALVLWVRIRAEGAALHGERGYGLVSR